MIAKERWGDMAKSFGEAMAKGEAVIFTAKDKSRPVEVFLTPGRELEVLQLLESKGIIKILRPAKPVSKKVKVPKIYRFEFK